MARIELKVTIRGIYSYERPAFAYGTETAYIYSMVDDAGTVYVWKTTKLLCMKKEDPQGWVTEKNGKKYSYDAAVKNDIAIITASVKGESEYNGEPQTELSRVKVKEWIHKAESYAHMMERKKAEKEEKKQKQLESIGVNDILWTMPYRQYKEHYSDCETVIDSYKEPDINSRRGTPEITVIIREGRLKKSGVRGKHYRGYEFIFTVNEKEIRSVYRAVSEETAVKQLKKQFPNAKDIQSGQIYEYYRGF